MQIELYCVFKQDDNGEVIFMHAFDDIDMADEYVFENEHEVLLVEVTKVNVPSVEE